MTEEEFNEMTPQQQADTFFAELAGMLRTAQKDTIFRSDNEETLVVSGMTTVVSVRTDLYP
jgi:hypothetical protein